MRSALRLSLSRRLIIRSSDERVSWYVIESHIQRSTARLPIGSLKNWLLDLAPSSYGLRLGVSEQPKRERERKTQSDHRSPL